MKNATLTQVTTLNARGNEWIIAACENLNNDTENKFKYAAFRREWITDGKVNRELNGIQMHVSATVKECIESVIALEEVNYLVESEGLTTEAAVMAYFTKKFSLA